MSLPAVCAALVALQPLSSAEASPNASQLVSATPSPTPESFHSKLQTLAKKVFRQSDVNEHSPQQSVDVADFSVAIARVLDVPSTKAIASPGSAQPYYKEVSSLLALYDLAIARAIHPLAASLAAHFPHANLKASSMRLGIIPIDRETAAVVAFSAGYQQHVFPDAAPPPPSPAPFADENKIPPGSVLRACHGAVDEGLVLVGADNHFYPHHWLTWSEFVNMIQVLRYYRQHPTD
jgi:hypothetical protein